MFYSKDRHTTAGGAPHAAPRNVVGKVCGVYVCGHHNKPASNPPTNGLYLLAATASNRENGFGFIMIIF